MTVRAGDQSLDPGAAVSLARRMVASGRLLEANQILGAVLGADPENQDAFQIQADIATSVGRPADAIRMIEKAIIARGDLASTHFRLSSMLGQTGADGPAANACRRAAILRPDWPRALYQLAVLAKRISQLRLARRVYQWLCHLEPDDSELWFNLGALVGRMGEPDDAAVAYRRSIILNPSWAENLRYFAISKISADDTRASHDNAVVLLNRAALIKPGNHEVHRDLGTVLRSGEDFRAAERAIRRQITLAPDQFEPTLTLADLQILAGWNEAGEITARHAIALRPSSWNGHFKYGLAQAKNNSASAYSLQLTGGWIGPGTRIRLHHTQTKEADLRQVTHAIPFRFDSGERLENLKVLTEYLDQTMPESTTSVCEEGPHAYGNAVRCTHYRHIANDKDYGHKTFLVNRIADTCETAVFIACDVDVLVPINQLRQATALILSGEADMVFPFDGSCYDLTRSAAPVLTATPDLATSSISPDLRPFVLGRRAYNVGSCVVWSLEAFRSIGMENETFKAWGAHDGEILGRALKLGLNVARVPGAVYHLDHPRPYHGGLEQYAVTNRQEHDKVMTMSTERLRVYVEGEMNRSHLEA
ncbi:MAG: hypothetical protein HOL85_09360 [Rhodospirillaceae bacterium]|nr:hypothetical protein [Rhodospirillaceae bacterium]